MSLLLHFNLSQQIRLVNKILTDKKVGQSIDIATKIIIEFCHFFPSLYTKVLITV